MPYKNVKKRFRTIQAYRCDHLNLVNLSQKLGLTQVDTIHMLLCASLRLHDIEPCEPPADTRIRGEHYREKGR